LNRVQNRLAQTRQPSSSERQTMDPFASTSRALGRASQRRTQPRSDSGTHGRRDSEPNLAEDYAEQGRSRLRREANDGIAPIAAPRLSRKSSNSNVMANTTQNSSKPSRLDQRASSVSVYDSIPEEYFLNPRQTDPLLHYLPKLAKDAGDQMLDQLALRDLLQAAEQDVQLHRARTQAALDNNVKLLRQYQLEKDPNYQARHTRLEERASLVQELESQASTILQALQEISEARGMTQAERTQLQLDRWQRALELFVLTNNHDVTWQSLLDQLLEGIAEDQDISQVLAQAAGMCQEMVERTQRDVKDTADHVVDLEASYLIRLEAHQTFTRGCLQRVNQIEEQFQTSGRAALQIGHQLEHAEVKRSQCEAASVLIRRWWLLENLAEQESTSGQLINVEEEIHGIIPGNACRMDPLFTKPENSLDASMALKQLRAVVRSRGNAAATGSAGGASAGIVDKESSRRFDLTAYLIKRTSDALEQRLLNSFSKVYTAGGIYDFSSKPRPGAIDWRELRALAQALLLFDSGRNLHKRYVDMVVTSRFPEFFLAKTKDGQEIRRIESEDEDFDMDATRSKLTSLFHRVSDVCTAEFELIGHVFGAEGNRTDILDGSEEMPLVVARALLQRVVSDPNHGLQARINDLLASIDRKGDFDAGAKKLDTFVVIHEKAAGLFGLLKDAADRMFPDEVESTDSGLSSSAMSARNAVESLKGYLTSQELSLSNQHRQGYINLEMRLLHHNCCSSLDEAGCTLVKGPAPRPDHILAEKGILEEFRAPVLPLHKDSLAKSGFTGILAGPLKQSVLRQPLIHATDSLARARLMFGTNRRGGETTARVILGIYNQMCCFYGECFLYPVVETLYEMLAINPPVQPPQLPFDEEQDAPDLGVSPAFWVALERVHSAAKSFDRELWAEDRAGSQRVWEILDSCGDEASIAVAQGERIHFFTELERRGESAILRALDTLSTHIQWVLVTGGESMMATGGTRIFNQLTGQSGGPYAIPSGSSLDTPNSPAVKSLTYCLRVQFVHVQAALTQDSLASFWTALSIRLYDILVARILQYYFISTVGAVILSRDVEALRSVAMLAGTDHSHWDLLRELLTLYMTPPDAIKNMLVGPEGDSLKGLFAKAGRDHCLVFLSRRNDYRFKTASGPKKSGWVTDLLGELNLSDPSDGNINLSMFAASRKK
jgi:hypothetical protein